MRPEKRLKRADEGMSESRVQEMLMQNTSNNMGSIGGFSGGNFRFAQQPQRNREGNGNKRKREENPPCNNLFIGYLPYSVTEDALRR